MSYWTVSQLIIDSGLIILIWLVQLIIYPSFRYIAEEGFIVWHSKYMILISLFVAPLLFFQTAIELGNIYFQSPRFIRLSIIAIIWFSTFYLSMPLHKRLHNEGKKREYIENLILTNWIRTVLWTILFFQTVIQTHKQIG